MIRVILQHKTNNVEELIQVLRETRTEAMKQKGYITGETLVNPNDQTEVLVISTWQSMEDWKAWDKCEVRVKLKERIMALLTEPFIINIYNLYTFGKRGSGLIS
jgi:heme oxygenase (mycobilin-producing)